MKTIIDNIDTLINEGKSFTWEKCSDGRFGNKPSGSWNSWVGRIENILRETVKAGSGPYIYFRTAKTARIAGNYREEFVAAKDGFIGALNSLKKIIEQGDAFNELLKTDQTDTLPDSQKAKEITSEFNKKKVFIVHGHDHNLKIELEVFLSHIGLKPIVLHREADEGKTIIEKFESNSDVAFVFILLTADEIAYTIDQEKLPDIERNKEFRARPNVIFEFGYFVAKLGRNRVCALHKGNVAIPSDLSGFIYKQINTTVEEIGFALIKELKAANLTLEI